MGRKKHETSPSEDEWSDMLKPDQMDLWLEAQRCVSMAQSLQAIQAGVVEAAGLVKQFIQPEQFMQLVADQCGTNTPPANCSLKQMVRWKHKSSDAVSDVAMAVLQGKVDELRQKIEQRKVRDAEMAANEEKLAAMMLIFQQEMTALQNPAGVVIDEAIDVGGVGREGGSEPLVGSGAAANGMAASPAMAAAAAAAAAAAEEAKAGKDGHPVVKNAAPASSPAAEAGPAAAAALAEPSPVAAALAAAPSPAAAAAAAAARSKNAAPAVASAGKRQLVPATTPSTVPAAEVAAGAPTAVSPPAKRLKAEGQHSPGGTVPLSGPGQQTVAAATANRAAAAVAAAAAAVSAKKAATAAAAQAASGKPGSVVVIPGNRSLKQAGAPEAWEDELERANRLEAAEEAAAAARQEQQLSASIQAQGGLVLPPEGFMAASNTHRMFKNRMKVTAYMTPDNVDDKTAGVKAHLDDQLFRFLDDHQVILMSYELLQCDTGKAFLHPEPPPMLTVQAVADVVTFEPTPGDIICGVVRKLSHNSITLLVLGCISVAIERPFIPTDWEYDLNSHCWVPGGDYTKAVSRGDLMTCMLLSYPKVDPDQEEVLFNLEGSLLTANTGLCSWQWPRQQRLRQVLAAHHGQAEVYGPEQEQQLQQQQKQLRQQKLTRRKLKPVEEISAQSSDSEDDDADQQQQQQQEPVQQQQSQQPQQQQDGQQLVQQPPQQQQQQQQQGKLSKEAKQAQKEAAKQAKREEKARLKAVHKAEKNAAKAAEKAAQKEARKAEKAAAKAQAKAEKRARDQQDAAAAAAGEQPPAKKHKHEQQQVAAAVQANGHADVQQQQNGKQSSSKHGKDKSEKGSSKKEKSGK